MYIKESDLSFSERERERYREAKGIGREKERGQVKGYRTFTRGILDIQ